MEEARAGRSRTFYRAAFVATAILVVVVLATLPFSVRSIVDDLLGSITGRVIPVTRTPASAAASTHINAHLAIVAIDEVALLATLRVSGHLMCEPSCSGSDRLVLFSVSDDDGEAEGMPPSASVLFPSSGEAVSQTIQLPLRGRPIHYPFDDYQLVLGVVLERVQADGHAETVPPDDAVGRLYLTVQELLPRADMTAGAPIDPAAVHRPGDPFHYLHVVPLAFARPPYLQVLALLLVLLIAAAASYAVFLRPLQDLIVNVGALVLGVWGIRAILVPGSVSYVTAIDLALSVVIIFLLGAITVKALLFVHDEGGLDVLRRRRRVEAQQEKDRRAADDGSDGDAPGAAR
jgi:hypothetical protein